MLGLAWLLLLLHANFACCSSKRPHQMPEKEEEENFPTSVEDYKYIRGDPAMPLTQARPNPADGLIEQFSAIDLSWEDQLMAALSAGDISAFIHISGWDSKERALTPRLQSNLIKAAVDLNSYAFLSVMMDSLGYLLFEDVESVFSQVLRSQQMDVFKILYKYQPQWGNALCLAVTHASMDAWSFILECDGKPISPKHVVRALTMADKLYGCGNSFIAYMLKYIKSSTSGCVGVQVWIALLEEFDLVEVGDLIFVFNVFFQFAEQRITIFGRPFPLERYRMILNRATWVYDADITLKMLDIGTATGYIDPVSYFNVSAKRNDRSLLNVLRSSTIVPPWVTAIERGNFIVFDVYCKSDFARESKFYGLVPALVRLNQVFLLNWIPDKFFKFMIVEELQRACAWMISDEFSASGPNANEAFKLLVSYLPAHRLKAENGESFLYKAAISGKVEVMEYLLDELKCFVDEAVYIAYEAGVSVVTYPIFGALKCADTRMLEFILSRNANVYVKQANYCSTNDPGRVQVFSVSLLAPTPHNHVLQSHVRGHATFYDSQDHAKESALFSAIEQCDLKYVREHYPSLQFKEFYNYSGLTLLHAAMDSGCEELVRFLIENGANVNIKSLATGETVLEYALQKGLDAIVELLLDKGALIDEQNRYGWSAAHYAVCFRNDNRLLNLLLARKVSIDTANMHGVTPLHMDAGHGNLPAIDSLLKSDVLTNIRSNHESTSLHAAADSDDPETIALLLVYDGAIDAKDLDGLTPLHYAVRNTRVKAARAFLQNGANVNTRDYGNRSPLLHAVWQDNLELVTLLLDYNAHIGMSNKERQRIIDEASMLESSPVQDLIMAKMHMASGSTGAC